MAAQGIDCKPRNTSIFHNFIPNLNDLYSQFVYNRIVSFLTHPVNIPYGRKPENPEKDLGTRFEKTHEF